MLAISVIIPTYKPKGYLWDCLVSLYSQTFPKSDYEVILVLNGEKDPYEDDIRVFLSSHAEMQCRFVQTKIAGVSNARNIGLDKSQGEYITFIDDDDYVSPSYLEELYSKADKETISLCRPIAFQDADNTEYENYRIAKEYFKYARRGRLSFYRPKKFFSGPCMKLIHRDIIGNRRFDKSFKNGEDSLFMFLLSDKMRWVVFTSPNAVYYRRYREGSAETSRRGIKEKLHNVLRLIYKYTLLFWEGFPRYSFPFYFTRVLAALRSIF